MAGKNTFRHGTHSSRFGGHRSAINFENADWNSLEEISKFEFNTNIRHEILNNLLLLKSEKFWCAENPNLQDIKRTLIRISKLSPDDAVIAVKNCDASTVAYIDEQTWKTLGLKRLSDQVNGRIIKLAARLALSELPKTKGGRPPRTDLNQLAAYCVELWNLTGNENKKAWVSEAGLITPILLFSEVLFNKYNGYPYDLYELAKLLRKYIR
jgi:hypothetical protein